MAELHIREQMVALGASLFARGYSAGSGGNLSVRLADGTFLMTPTNSCLGRLDADRLSRICLDGTLVAGDPPTKESAFHLALYRARPDCGAVVHLHSTYAVALSCLLGLDEQDVIRPFTPYYVMKIAPLPLLPYFKPGSPKLAELLEAKARTAKCFLLSNHGPVVMGKNLEEAVNIAEELEETAKLVFLLRQGQGEVRHLSGAEIQELLPSH